jgi:hypothetical protein
MIYRDSPVFIGLANQSPSSINNNYYLMASQVSIDMTAGAQAKKQINQPINQYDQFTHSDPLLCKISIQSYIPGSNIESFSPGGENALSDLSWAAKIILNQSTGNNYHPIRIGGNNFDKCYLESYTVDINPLRPIILSAEFICNNPPTGSGILYSRDGVDSFIGTKNFSDKIIYGHTCSVSGVDDVASNTQSSIKYQVTCQRSPVYQVGSIMPSLMMLDGVERQMDINSTDISKIINQEGSALIKPISIKLAHEKKYSTTAYLNMSAGSKLLSQKINTQEGDTLSTQVSIKEILNISKDILSFPTIPTVYTISLTTTSVNEGGTITFNASTLNVPDGTTLYYSVKHISTHDTDFEGPTFNSFLIEGGQGSFSIVTKTDFDGTEPAETFRVIITNAIFEQIYQSNPIEIKNISNPATYTLLENKTSVNENETVIFTVNTNLPNGSKVPYDILHITTSPSDFIGPISGEVTIQNGTGSFVIETNPDLTTESAQTFRAIVRNLFLLQAAQSNIITITDSSQGIIPVYTITTAGITSVNEGSSISFLVTTSNVANGTIINYDIENDTTVDADFTSKSGQITINNGSATFIVTTRADSATEGSQTFRGVLKNDFLEKIQQSSLITIIDSSQTPVAGYTITQSPIASVSEGSSITFTVTTTNVNSGTTLYYNIEHITTNSNDFTGNTSGSMVTSGNIATFTITANADLSTEGEQTFRMKVLTGSINGTLVVTSNNIKINDTSLSPVPTYLVSPSPSSITSIDEGSTITFAVTTTLIANGTILYYNIDYNNSSQASDFTGATSGPITINGNTGTFSITTNADTTLEGSQTFKVKVLTGSISGTTVATSNAIIINDTSNAPVPTYSISQSATSIGEDENVTFTVTTTNVPNGTTLYYNIEHITTDSDDFTSATSGSINILNNTSTFTITTSYNIDNDGVNNTYTDETFRMKVLTGSISGTTVVTSNNITIKPSSQQELPDPTWSVLASFQALTTDPSNHGVSINIDGTVIAYCSTTNKTIETRRHIGGGNYLPYIISLGSFNFGPNGYFQTSLSQDGNTLAIHIRQNFPSTSGFGAVYIWNSGTSSWVQRGVNFDDALIDVDDGSISLSGDGSVVAIGGGNVARVYSWGGSSWQALGGAIQPPGIYWPRFGDQIVLNYTGNVVAVVTNAMNLEGKGVDVYELISNTWSTRNIRTVFSSTIDAIKLNNDGNIIAIAGYIGSLADPLDQSVPVIAVFRWRKSNNTWVRMGNYIYTTGSTYAFALPNMSMSMDSTASRIIWSINSVLPTTHSLIRVVDWAIDDWFAQPSITPSPTVDNNNGRSMALSANGKAIVYGSTVQDKVELYQSST